jgi:predicted regulator of Ras-like GTPase activity (Roadblock/LC7/MglB family)
MTENKRRIDRDVTTTFTTGNHSTTMIISKEIAKRYGIDEPSHVVIEGTDQGILIRKLNLDEVGKVE